MNPWGGITLFNAKLHPETYYLWTVKAYNTDTITSFGHVEVIESDVTLLQVIASDEIDALGKTKSIINRLKYEAIYVIEQFIDPQITASRGIEEAIRDALGIK